MIISSMIVFLSLLLTGCSSFATFEGTKEERPDAYANAYELNSGCAYVWDNPEQEDLCEDLKSDRKGNSVFFLCPKGTNNFKGEETADTTQFPRSIWIGSDKDDMIPTVTSKNALIYVSESSIPEDIIFERFADYGYTVGISNLAKDGGGHYYITYAGTDADDYKYFIDPDSDAVQVTFFKDLDRLYLDRAGEILVREETVSDGGTVTGLEKDKTYICEFYTGTFYQDYALTANVHAFGSMERFICHDYEFLHANCIRLKIPEWFKSGYYFVQGVGLFRYVTDEDLKNYNGEAYDAAIKWNDPVKEYDSYGVCIFDPSMGIDTRNMQGPSDRGLTEEEIMSGREEGE